MDKAVNIMSSVPLMDTPSIQITFLPYHSLLGVTMQPGDTTTKVPCRLCEERVEKKVMRRHVDNLILKDDLGIVCGFCGLGTCSIDLVRESGRGKTISFVPGSNCQYQVKFSLKSAETPTKSGPCSNRPIRCIQYKTIQWSYNLPQHCRDKHSDHPIPSTDDEKKLIGIWLNTFRWAFILISVYNVVL